MSADFSYLDILDKKLDKSQRAACCRGLNTVVAAGAGSGKTQVLATRFAWLVMSCNIKVEEILALTFTKKAASEIYQRIYKTLGQFAANAQTPPEEKARAKQALKDFDNTSDVDDGTAYGYFNFLYLVEDEQTQFLVKAI